MKLDYDKKTDSLYFELRKGKYERSKKVSDGVVVDFDKDGKVLGIEILTVKDIIPSFAPGKTKNICKSSVATA
jgi:uncharacterized protein YuzE